MMRRNIPYQYYWSRYRMPTSMPKFDGPAPVAAPQNMNSTKTNEFIDPIDDKFPTSIRGPLVRPDVPDDQYVDSWYVCTSMTHHLGDFRPWSSSAPANAFRFRPFDEFDAKGREYVRKLREYSRFDAAKTVGAGQEGFPFREAYLTKMNPENVTTRPPSLETVMDRAIMEQHHKQKVLSPLEVQRDVGRVERPLPCAGKTVVDASTFPFNWRTEDWYEYEVSKVRARRFKYENTEKRGIHGSEVTYKIVLEGFWDHHVAKLAEDVCAFLRDVGRQVAEEKLAAVRQMREGCRGGVVDPELLAAFNASKAGPFGKPDSYDAEEVAQFLKADLDRLEEQCVGVINRSNVPIPAATNLYDPEVSWPHVEKLEPWVRMAEFWTSSSDVSYTDLEMSTAHYEFRKYFRVVVVKLPFQSTEFEKRMYDIRHWLHRQTSCEFHTVYRRNVVHNNAVFPVEHNPSVSSSHEQHRLFSFALDWESAPVNRMTVHTVKEGDTWESLATLYGCTSEEFRASNVDVELSTPGAEVHVPLTATKRLPSFSTATRVLPLKKSDGAPIRTWEEAAAALQCTVEELQQANGPAALSYSTEGHFDASVQELVVPPTAWEANHEGEFAAREPVYASDSFESIAHRLQCSTQSLRAANAGVEDLAGVSDVAVPLDAKAPRRLVDPQLRHQTATDMLLPRTIGEKVQTGLDSIPQKPANAEKFPHEYHTPTSRFPTTPKLPGSEDNWMSYTARFLDKEFSMHDEATPVYHVNKLWPMQPIPGKVDQTPFEEDQTWFMHPIPVQQMEQHHPEKDLQDLPFVNQEQLPRSVEWSAP